MTNGLIQHVTLEESTSIQWVIMLQRGQDKTSKFNEFISAAEVAKLDVHHIVIVIHIISFMKFRSAVT